MAVLDLFRSTAHLPGEDLHILCDSQYVINSVTKWMPGWKRKGWRKSDGKPVMNVELLKEIDQALVGRKYTFEWVRGHAGHDLNEAADDRARAAATAYQQGVAVRPGSRLRRRPRRPPWQRRGSRSAPRSPRQRPRRRRQRVQRRHRRQTGRQPARSANRRSSTNRIFSASSTRTPRPRRARTRARKPSSRPWSASSSARKRARTWDVPECCCTRTSPKSARSGRIWTRDAMMMSLEENPGGPIELELLGADRLGEQTVLLTYRSHTRDGTALRSSLWVLDGAQWRLRFHQGTPEA